MTKELDSIKIGVMIKEIAEMKSEGVECNSLIKETFPIVINSSRVNLDEVLDGHDRRTITNDTNGKHERHWKKEIRKIKREEAKNGY